MWIMMLEWEKSWDEMIFNVSLPKSWFSWSESESCRGRRNDSHLLPTGMRLLTTSFYCARNFSISWWWNWLKKLISLGQNSIIFYYVLSLCNVVLTKWNSKTNGKSATSIRRQKWVLQNGTSEKQNKPKYPSSHLSYSNKTHQVARLITLRSLVEPKFPPIIPIRIKTIERAFLLNWNKAL